MTSVTACPPAVHPRVCGEHICLAGLLALCTGSSPRVRGTRLRQGIEFTVRRFIPACAGNTLVDNALIWQSKYKCQRAHRRSGFVPPPQMMLHCAPASISRPIRRRAFQPKVDIQSAPAETLMKTANRHRDRIARSCAHRPCRSCRSSTHSQVRVRVRESCRAPTPASVPWRLR